MIARPARARLLPLVLLLVLLGPAGVWAAATRSDNGDGANNATVVPSNTTASLPAWTINAGSSLWIGAFLAFSGDPGTITVTWNGSETLSAVTSNLNGRPIYLYGRVAPTTGNHTLTASWTNSVNAVLGAVAFSGVDQSAPVVTAHTTSNDGADNLTVTSSTDGATIVAMVTESLADPSDQNLIFNGQDFGVAALGASYALSNASNTHTFSVGGGLATAHTLGIHLQAVQVAASKAGGLVNTPILKGLVGGGLVQ